MIADLIDRIRTDYLPTLGGNESYWLERCQLLDATCQTMDDVAFFQWGYYTCGGDVGINNELMQYELGLGILGIWVIWGGIRIMGNMGNVGNMGNMGNMGSMGNRDIGNMHYWAIWVVGMGGICSIGQYAVLGNMHVGHIG